MGSRSKSRTRPRGVLVAVKGRMFRYRRAKFRALRPPKFAWALEHTLFRDDPEATPETKAKRAATIRAAEKAARTPKTLLGRAKPRARVARREAERAARKVSP
jgi:hypothetical protein